jgi:tetratricopeptide (TPR) repeat protein
MELADRTEALMQALGEGKGLHMRYDAEATLTAEQAFAQRRANCLSYTMLFVALAREVGIPAQFNEVDIPPIWDLGDDRTSLLYLHINARVELPLRFYQVVDVSGEEIDPSYKQQVIADAEAQAQFYNNRAAQLRLEQRPGDALRYEVRALELAPDAAYLWTNLASLYLLRGEARAARIAITQSLKLDSTSLAGYDTAAAVYRKLGEPKLALYFQQRAEYFLDQNPYRHYQLALEALLRQDKREAFEQARRAILLYPKDARFFFLMAVVENQLGDMDRAEESLRVAVLLEPDAARQERYKSKFARLVGERG